MIQLALRYALIGWPVLPLEPRGKNPLSRLVRHGVAHATTDASVIRDWWRSEPDANIGIACRDLIVVDVDPRNGGEEALRMIQPTKLPRTPTARTGSRGWHFLFQRPAADLAGKLTAGVDLVHGARRYIVAAPSVHPNGEHYRWVTPPSVPVAPLPQWVIDRARRPEFVPVSIPRLDTPRDERVRRARAYAAYLEPAISGQGGHSATFKAAATIARGFALSEDEALFVLSEWNERCQPPWSERELKRKIREALTKGRQTVGELLERRSA